MYTIHIDRYIASSSDVREPGHGLVERGVAGWVRYAVRVGPLASAVVPAPAVDVMRFA